MVARITFRAYNMCAIALLGCLVLVLALTQPTGAHEPFHFIFDIEGGAKIEQVRVQQGWYDCEVEKPFSALCFDRAAVFGTVGRFQIRFYNGKAHSAELLTSGIGGVFGRLLKQIANLRYPVPILITVKTKNAEIDPMRATHDLGFDEARERFSRYLAPEAYSELERVTLALVFQDAPTDATDGPSLLADLPSGSAVLTISQGAQRHEDVKILFELPSVDITRLFPDGVEIVPALPCPLKPTLQEWLRCRSLTEILSR